VVSEEQKTESAAAPPIPRTQVVLGLAFMSLIWGATWLVIRIGLRDLPPFTALFLRFAIAATGFVLLARLLAKREGGSDPPLRLTAILGTLNYTGSYCIVYYVEQFIPSALASLLFATYPLMLAIGAHFVLPGERLRRAQALGFVLGFLGVALLFLRDVPHLGHAAFAPAFVMLLSPTVVMLGTLYVKRHGSGVSSLKLNRNAMILAATQIGAVALVTEHGRELRFTAGAVLSVLFLSVFGTVATFGLYYWMMRRAPANLMALTAYLTPALAVFLGATIANERVTAATLAGASLILFGVFLASRRRPTRIS
jgi:drug/metabolite transporter (DMT)-like permease